MEILENYFADVLDHFLVNAGLDNECIKIVHADIEKRFENIMSLWENTNDRRSYLEVSREEAVNYEPKNEKLSIRMLINSAIRNSILEDLSTEFPYTQEFQNHNFCISDQIIRKINIASIKYFSNKELPNHDICDTFFIPKVTHPITYQAMLQLSNITKDSTSYEPVTNEQLSNIENKYSFLDELKNIHSTNFISGYDPTLDDNLKSAIYHIRENKGTFFTPYFKLLTRNIVKLYDIFELILSSDGEIVTLNYLIKNGFVCKREKLLKVAHTTSDCEQQMKIKKGLCKEHRKALKST